MKGFFIAVAGGLVAAGGVVVAGYAPEMTGPQLALAAALLGGCAFGVVLAMTRIK